MDSNKTKLDPDCVCPVCFKQIKPSVMEPELVTDGVRRRFYSCWHDTCAQGDNGYIVVQFYHGGRWRIEKYISIRPLYVFTGNWVSLQQAQPVQQQMIELPPAIQTGPGGDFTIKMTDAEMAKALESYENLLVQLSSCVHLIRDILLNRSHE